MNKIIRRITAAALAGVMAAGMAMTASAQSKYCTCGKTQGVLDVTKQYAIASTGSSQNIGVTASAVGTFEDKDTGKLRTYSSGNTGTGSTTVCLDNLGGQWVDVTSTHSGCLCGSFTIDW